MRSVRTSLLVSLCLCLLVGTSLADVRTHTFGSGENSLTLLSQEADLLRYSIELGELAMMDVSTSEGVFTRLLLPGFHTSKRVGEPELPMMNRLIEVPFGASVRVEVISVESRSFSLADLGIEHPLFPTQPSMPKNVEPEDWPFVYDPAAYDVDRIAQELVAVSRLGRLRAVDIGRLEVSPVEYLPRENRITVHERIELRIHFDGADHVADLDLKARTNSPFFAPLYERIEGYRGLHDDYPDRVADVVTMVVVAPPEFEYDMQAFVDWKRERGFHTILAITGTPEVGVTKEEIQSYIHNLYLNGTPELPSPSFVLFVGDVAQMPTWSLSGDATDRPYCDVDGDLVPDIYYGRFSATNPTQLGAILDKTLMYDQFTMPDPSYLGEVVMIAGMDSGHGATWGNGQINYGTTYYFNEAHGILSHTYLYPESGQNAANIVQHVSDGVAYINYTAHGSETSWSDPYFSQNDVNSLQNDGKYCTAVGNCCLTSTYDYPECFAETWLRVPNKGAIGYIGGSNSTYWDEDYWWGVGYTASIIANPTYEQSGLGAYDGVFHDHGEAMEQWYVTNDALVFSGNLAVMESGSSLTTYYWNIYNLMGDPSISTYMGVPSANPVVYPETIFTNWATVTIEATAGSYVGLTKDGVLIAAGTVDGTGSVELDILVQPLTPGTAHMVVMAQNREPYVADINVIVPATVYLDPGSIDANVETVVSVGVFEEDGVTPKVGIEVWADGLGYESGHAFTDETGYCTITILYPYGPTIDVVGKDPNDPYELFHEPLAVNAQLLFMVNLTATTEIGLADTLALNLPGTLHATVSQPNHVLWALLNGEEYASTTEHDLNITPPELGTVTGVIAVSGYNLYTEDFPVIRAYGTLSGYVDAAGAPADGATVQGYDTEGSLVFETTTNALGNYEVGQDIVCALYTLTVDYFGCLHHEEGFFVNYGPNVCDIYLEAAPSGVLSGTVLENETDVPLAATIKIYRTDNGELYTETVSSDVDGTYATGALPYFDYTVVVKAYRHIPQTVAITIEQANTVRNFWLDVTIGDLLVIDDTSKGGLNPTKIDEKTGEVIAEGYATESAKALQDILDDLETLGYTMTVETMSSDPGTWETYDLLMVASGSNTSPLGDAGFRSDLINYVESGGHLLIEGGEVGYDHYNDSQFAQTVLHISDWDADQSGNVTVVEPDHYVMSVPNVIPGPISMSYAGYGDQDAVDATADAVRVASWTSYPANASIVCYDTNPAPEGGQIVFFAFNYSAMDAAVRPQLLQNTITWLITPEFGDCSVSGRAYLVGQTDHSGVRVEAIPNGGFVYTDVDGSYTLPGLFAGPYTIKASKEGWSTATEEVDLEPGQTLTDVDFFLGPTETSETCRNPNLNIPDNNPTGVYDVMPVLLGATITEIAVYVDITHTYIGDLIVSVSSPSGTEVVLHNRTGGSSHDIVGWYPDDLTPAESLDALIGESTDGLWTLHVSDRAGADVGTLNSWCLRITYGGASAGAEETELPTILALGANHPNPFNPRTSIRYELPSQGEIDLSIFDVSGRKVTTLVSGPAGPGRYTAIWTGHDDAGIPVSGGIYFYRLRADGRTLTRKMVLLK